MPLPSLLRPARTLGLASLIGAALLPSAAHAGLSQLSRLFVFGDSLSDNGNSKVISNGVSPPPVPPPPYTFPPAPYFDGRFSNGLVAAEYLWQAFNPAPANPPLRASLQGGTNFAVGGASTGVENFVEVWSVTPTQPLKDAYANKGNAWQLDQFGTPAFDPETSLFLVWLFPNDPFYYANSGMQGVGTFDGTGGGPSTVAAIVPNAVNNIVGSINELADKGARNFLVPNSPDLGLIPEFIGNAGQSAFFSALSTAFNNGLATALNGLAVSRPELDIEAFQTDDLFAAVRADPTAYGFNPATIATRCISTPSCVGGTPEVQSTFLFWDGSHPTTAGHALIGGSFFDAVYEPVPGPLPLAGGAVALAWSRRLRRRLRLRSRRTSRSCAGRCRAD